MQRIKCEIREAGRDDHGMLVLLAEETLHPLAEGAGHPERYHTGDIVGLLERADVFVAECDEEPGGFVAAETDRGRVRGALHLREPRVRGPRSGQPAARLGRGPGDRAQALAPGGLGTRGRRALRCACTGATASADTAEDEETLALEKRLPAAD